MTGYDGTAELLVYEQATAAIAHGYNVLVFEGPGQGSVPRFTHLYFTHNWDRVIRAMVDYIKTRTDSKIALWGISFGGNLAPLAFSNIPELSALVVNGGIVDFYSLFLCNLPQSLRDLYFSNREVFEHYMNIATDYSLGLQFMYKYGVLGFNVSSFGSLIDAFEPFVVNSTGIGSRPVIVYDPIFDWMATNQSRIFWDKMVQPRSPHSKYIRLTDPASGGALHCGIGSTIVTSQTILEALDEIFPVTSDSDSGSSPAAESFNLTLVIAIVSSCLFIVTAVSTCMMLRKLRTRSSNANSSMLEKLVS